MKPQKLPGIAGLKQTLRQQARTRLAAMAEEERARASLEICRLAAGLTSVLQARTLAVFAPLPAEPDLHPLVEEAWAREIRVVFPVLSRESDVPRLDWLAVRDWEQLVISGPFGIREPNPGTCAPVDLLELDCILVPGLAFDRRGHRLGRGGGYYDVALAGIDVGTPRLGVMFACQQVADVPRDAHDQILEGVLTEEGFVKTVSP